MESGLTPSDADIGNSKLGTVRDSGADDPGASGAARDASGAPPYKKKSQDRAFTSRMTSGVKATLRRARNAIATTLVLTVIMTIFVVLIHQLGWIATHQKPPIME